PSRRLRAVAGACTGTATALVTDALEHPMAPQLEYVLRTVEERGVRFVQLWFTDVLGALKGFAITPAELEGALEEGMSFDGSAIEAYSRVQESDMLAMPDPSAAGPSSPSRRWASRSSTRSTRTVRASTRSTCATPTRCRWPTT